MKVLEVCRWAEKEFSELESPRLEAELLLCHLMNWKRHELYLNHSNEIIDSSLKQYREIVLRRKNREPLQHITGRVDFLGRSFIAGRGALIARPETESLTECFIKELSSPSYILDVGTGSGVIAVSLALEFPAAVVIGTDISRKALTISQRNSELFGPDNLSFIRTDLLKTFGRDSRIFDGVIANLPYIPSSQISDLEPEVRNGDPLIALDGGTDGLELISRLIDTVPGILTKGGILALELDREQVEPISDILRKDPIWMSVKTLHDLTGRMRIIIARKGSDATCGTYKTC
ncbi:MAG: peptide chain release factor N(5)-glutamine methyltransferase [Candidatus Aegiribacteria sp.]|nr:peptide chain release factor N(5)-glutamine methyltransferase [Candidatus Aegiribacteria sp.]